MRWRHWLSLATLSLASTLAASPAVAQLAPTGGHYASQPSDTGFAGAVNSSGGYGASVPLDLPGARGGIPVPVSIIYGGRGVGAAGPGWDVPLSYVVRDNTIAHRRPMPTAGGGWQAREAISLVLDGRALDLVRTASGYAARRDGPDLVLRQQADGTWVMFDGQGRTYSFTVAAATGAASMWLLKSITGVGGSKVELDYSITTPPVPGGVGLAIDLTTVSYNPHPVTASCYKNQVSLLYDGDAAAPLSFSVLGERTLTRMHKLVTINVKSKATCGDSYVRLRGYQLAYTQDVDTHRSRLSSVSLVGREDRTDGSTPIPLASYSYGTATSNGALRYQLASTVVHPSDKRPFTTLDTTLSMGANPGYAAGGSILDVTGDGLPDQITYRNSAVLYFLYNWMHDGGIRSWDSSFPKKPFDYRTLEQIRYQTVSNVDRVWRQAIDVNGDGRIDVIDASTQAGHWVVYLNTPDPSDPRFTQWVTRSYSIQHLAAQLSARGLSVDPNFVPLSQRTTRRPHTVKQCWLWQRGHWTNTPNGFNLGTCDGPQISDGLETTFTEWEVIDVNGDGYPDVVFNSTPVGVETVEVPPPSDPPPEPDLPAWVTTSTTSTPTLPSSNGIDAVFNVLGVRFGADAQPFSSATRIRTPAQCGVARWSPVDDSHQELTCGIIDVNGDGIADRVSSGFVYLGTGVIGSNGFFMANALFALPGALATQDNAQATRCASGNGDTMFTTSQTAGLRDLTGDGIPDYFTANGSGAGNVQIGTGTGFLPAIPIDGMFLALSQQTEDCAGRKSTTTAGLFDVDGDGKPDVLTSDGKVYQVVSNEVLGAPQAGQLVQIDNRFGATTIIRYRSAKLLAPSGAINDLHQVPFPEIVVDSVETTQTQSGATLLAKTQYAYGGAQLVFDSTQDAFRFPGYHRHVALRLPVEQAPGQPPEGVATITDIYEPSNTANPFDLPASLDEAQRYARSLRVGRVSDITVLSGNVGTDPSLLLSVNAATHPRRIASTHYEWDARLLTVAGDPAGPEPCSEMVYPYDYAASVGFASIDACRQRGFAFTTSVESLRSEPGAAPASGAAAITRTETQAVDDFGRVTRMKQLGDVTRTDDDLCVDTSFATPTGTNERVLSAVSTQTVTDCGTTIYAKETSLYDELALGQVSGGLPTTHTVERRSDTGALLGTVREFDAQFNSQGNAVVVRTIRDDGAARSVSIRYDDAFALAPIIIETTATGLPAQRIDLGRDPLTLNVTTSRDANLTVSSTRFDGYDRPVMSTVTPPGGVEGALSCMTYEGFGGGDSNGRRITTKVFTDALPPATACAASGRTATVYIDELGRERITYVDLGADYPGVTMKAGDRTYDSLGRVLFEADPYPSNQDSATAYGTSQFFRPDGSPLCTIRGRGRQPQPFGVEVVATDEASEIYPTCFRHTFHDNVEDFAVKDASSLLAGSPQAGAVKVAGVTAMGRLLGRSTFHGGNRIEHADFTNDRLGRLTSMRRYQNAPASTDPVTTRWHFDSLGQVLELDEPDSPPKFSVYSSWGELLETNRTVAGSLKRVVQRYDALGRLTHSEQQTGGVVDPETVHDYRYDTPVQVAPQVTAANTLGRLAQATWPTGSVTFSYDGLGRNNAQVFTDAQGIHVEKHTFHADGSPLSLDLFLPDTAFANEHVEYSADSAGRGRNVTYTSGSNSQTLYHASTIDPFGRVREAAYGLATYTAAYNDIGRRLMTQVAVTSLLGSRSISYAGFDPLGRERARTEIKTDTSGNPTTTSATTSWTYDALGRLSSAVRTRGSTTELNQQFIYDPLSNLLALNNVGTGAPNTTLTYSTTDRDRICRIASGADSGTGCNVTYDELGSILSQPTPTGSRQYTYLVDGAVQTIRDGHGSLAHYRYDAFGQVQELDLDTSVPTDVRQDRHLGSLFTWHYETSGSPPTRNSVLIRNIPGPDGFLATRHGPGGPWTFAFGEQRGNRFFTDQAGAFVQDVDYQPFGKPTSTGAATGSQLYSSEQWNSGDALAAFGISQLGARLYDPVIGRFISRDPLLITRTATTTNPYAFADNDPVNLSDPTGLEPKQCVDDLCITRSVGAPPSERTPYPDDDVGSHTPDSSEFQWNSGQYTGHPRHHTSYTPINTSRPNPAAARALLDMSRGQAVWDAAMQAGWKAVAARSAQSPSGFWQSFCSVLAVDPINDGVKFVRSEFNEKAVAYTFLVIGGVVAIQTIGALKIVGITGGGALLRKLVSRSGSPDAAALEARKKALGTDSKGRYIEHEGAVGVEIEEEFGGFERDQSGAGEWLGTSGTFKGRSFDLFGLPPNTSQFHGPDMAKFLPSIDHHFRKSVDYVILDVRNMTPDQRNSVLHYIDQKFASHKKRLTILR